MGAIGTFLRLTCQENSGKHKIEFAVMYIWRLTHPNWTRGFKKDLEWWLSDTISVRNVCNSVKSDYPNTAVKFSNVFELKVDGCGAERIILIKQSFSLQGFHMVMPLFHPNKVLLQKVCYLIFHFLLLLHVQLAKRGGLTPDVPNPRVRIEIS